MSETNINDTKKVIVIRTIIGIVALVLVGMFMFNIVKGFFYYDDKYYVNLFPENNTSKNYRVEANIFYDNDYGEYYIEKAYFPNNGYITFDNSFGIPDNALEFNKKVLVKDDKGRYWNVELTKQRVKK